MLNYRGALLEFCLEEAQTPAAGQFLCFLEKNIVILSRLKKQNPLNPSSLTSQALNTL